jgi:hypothetical protein
MRSYKVFLIMIALIILFFAYSTQEAEAQAECPAAKAGNFTLTESCVIPSGKTMSIIDGNLTIASGVTLWIEANSRLTITPATPPFTISPIGTISKNVVGATIVKKTHSVILNSVSSNTCSTVCTNNGKSCVSIGQDSNATDTYYWSASVCTGAGSCSYNGGSCGTVMSDQCPGEQNAACCAIDVYWTRCLCVTP